MTLSPLVTTRPTSVNVIVKMPIGSEPIKYKLDKALGYDVRGSHALYGDADYPGNYGFVPHTLSDDGDPINVLIANSRPIVPGAVLQLQARVSILFFMRDEAGGDI